LAKIFCHFANVGLRTNVFREEVIADHTEEENKNTLQDCWRNSKPDWIIFRSKSHALHTL